MSKLEVWKGSEREVPIGFAEDLVVSIPRGKRDQLKAQMQSIQPLVAPISAGQAVGTLRLNFSSKPYGEHSVIALSNVGLANFLVRAWDGIRLRFK